jgi:hypothetical protein
MVAVDVVRRRRRLLVAVVIGLGLHAWWVTELRPFTWPSLAAVVGSGLAAVALAWRHRVGPPRRGASPAGPGSVPGRPEPVPARLPQPETWRAGVVAWWGLIALLGLWELAAYLQHPRTDHPTLSSLLDSLLADQPLRAAAFAAWLVGTYRLARP